MSSSTSRPQSTRSRRVKSATARITPPPPPQTEHGIASLESVKEKNKRVTSAKANREKNESSKKVFPSGGTKDRLKERYLSIYNKDFEGTYITPTEPRPTSPTRRNNPHPSQQFMVWRVPSREIGAQFRPGSSMGGPVRDDESEFDDMESLYERYKVPLPQPSSMEYGAYLREMRQRQMQQQLQQQQQQLQFSGDRIPSRLSQRGEHYGGDPYMMPPQAPSGDVLSRTVKESNQDNLAEWLQTASPNEKKTILKMLKEAEEGQVKQTIGQVMKPGAAKATADWLSKAGQDERDVAVRLFSSLGSRSGQRQRSLSEPNARPLSRRNSLPLPPDHQSLVEQRLHNPTVDGKPWPKSLWHHLPVRDPPPRVYHRGSLFGKATGGASHYTIHPEWPDYYQQSGFNSDAVH